MTPEPLHDRYPAGDLALLAAITLVGLWPFFALWLGEAPPDWELGVGTVLVLMALAALAGGSLRRTVVLASPRAGQPYR